MLQLGLCFQMRCDDGREGDRKNHDYSDKPDYDIHLSFEMSDYFNYTPGTGNGKNFIFILSRQALKDLLKYMTSVMYESVRL